MSETRSRKSSRLPAFYQRSLAERLQLVAEWAALSDAERAALEGTVGLDAAHADYMIENAIGVFGLPLGIATNFLINGRDYLVPMATEEPSVVAACSYAAKLIRAGGGFQAGSDEPVMIGQLQVLDIPDAQAAAARILAQRERLLAAANNPTSSIVRLGGGARDVVVRPFSGTPLGEMVIVHLLYDVRDAMGANAINTACEQIAPLVAAISGGRVHLRILSNLCDQRKAWATCRVLAAELATQTLDGIQVARAIVEASVFAELDPYRAATHNKGIMNGMDAVCIATGNDWRALEAGAHAYAARDGRYTSLTRWWQAENGDLCGELRVPLAVGIIGGATRVHPAAVAALKLLGVQSARELAEVIVCVGLAQNLAALRALATEGIQRGHMSLHARQIALAAGATGDQVSQVVAQLLTEGNVRLERAKQLVAALNGNS